MTTKLIDSYTIDRDELNNGWVDFLSGNTANQTNQLRLIQSNRSEPCS